MFFHAPSKPTRLKKVIYLFCFVVLGLLLSVIAHALIEISYLNLFINKGKMVQFYGGCALPPVFQAVLWILGAIGGFLLGLFCWRKVYIERSWKKKRL